MLSVEALQIDGERREMKDKAERERYTEMNVELQRIESRNKKAFLGEQCKEIEDFLIAAILTGMRWYLIVVSICIFLMGNDIDGEALYSQQEQNLVLTEAQIMSSLLQSSGLN